MVVKVILLRRVSPDKTAALKPLLLQLRSLALNQPGYISGETLINGDDPEEYLVISTWKSIDDWNAWFHNTERRQVQSQVDELLGQETYYQVYYSA